MFAPVSAEDAHLSHSNTVTIRNISLIHSRISWHGQALCQVASAKDAYNTLTLLISQTNVDRNHAELNPKFSGYSWANPGQTLLPSLNTQTQYSNRNLFIFKLDTYCMYAIELVLAIREILRQSLIKAL